MTGSELLSRFAAGERDFRGAYLRGANLRGADLSGVNLRGANLRGAGLSRANLSGARGLPVDRALARAVADQIQRHPETHNQSTWHASCGTAHCVAGWFVVKAGTGGRALELLVGTPTAAYLLGCPTGVDFSADAALESNLGLLRGEQ